MRSVSAVTEGPQRPPGLLDTGYRATTIGFVSIVTLIAFETLAVGTAMPTIVTDLDGLRLYGWAFTSLLTANVVGVALGGELCDRIGVRPALLLGVVSLVAGLSVAGLSATMSVFLVGRAAQGFGGGMVIVSLYLLAATVYDEDLRPRLFAVEAAAWVVPAMVGPFVAGVAVDHVSWRSLFLAIAPLAVGSSLLIWPASRVAQRHPVTLRKVWMIRRWMLALPAAAGLAAIQYAGQNLSWATALWAVLGIVILAVTLPRLLPRGLFSLRAGVPVIVLSRGLANGAYNGIVAFLPLMLVTAYGYSATAAGLPLTLGTLGWAAASWVQGKTRTIAVPVRLRAGFALLALAAALLAGVAVDILPGMLAYPIWIAGGAGVGTVFPTLSVQLLHHSPSSTMGANSAGFSMAETMAAAITVGLGGGLVAAAEQQLLTLSCALATTFALMGLIALLGSAVAGRTSLLEPP